MKRDDHFADVARYICMQRPLRPERDRIVPTMTTKDRLLRHALKSLKSSRRVPGHDSGPGIFAG